MSLVSLAKSIMNDAYPAQTTLLWVLNQIDMKKFTERVSQSYYCPDIETKCVLLEYNYTAWSDVKNGEVDKSDRLPGTDLLVHTALSTPEFWRLANQYIVGDDLRASIYIRRKTNRDGSLDIHKRQLVLVFAKPPPPSPVSFDGKEYGRCD